MGILTGLSPMTFIVTTDLARAKAFYGDVLGLPQTSEDQFATVYDLGGTPLRLSTVPAHQPGMHTVLGWTCPDARAAATALTDKGVVFNVYPGFEQDELGIWSAPGGAKVAWFPDPDGNVLSITEFPGEA